MSETIAVGTHEVEERASGVEFREAEGCEGSDVDGDEGEDVSMPETAPEPDLSLEFGLELIVLDLCFAGDDSSDHFHSANHPYIALEGVSFADNAEATVADLTAEYILADFLPFAVRFRGGLFARGEFGEKGCGRGDGG